MNAGGSSGRIDGTGFDGKHRSARIRRSAYREGMGQIVGQSAGRGDVDTLSHAILSSLSTSKMTRRAGRVKRHCLAAQVPSVCDCRRTPPV
jgi:hypothetical protein